MSSRKWGEGCVSSPQHPQSPMVGQASSPDIMMTSGDACPTNEGSLKVVAKGSLIYVQEFQSGSRIPLGCVPGGIYKRVYHKFHAG